MTFSTNCSASNNASRAIVSVSACSSGLSQQTPHRQIGDLPDPSFIVDDDGLAVVILLVVVGEVLIDFGAGPTVESVAPTSAG